MNVSRAHKDPARHAAASARINATSHYKYGTICITVRRQCPTSLTGTEAETRPGAGPQQVVWLGLLHTTTNTTTTTTQPGHSPLV